ncbi:MAG TPA: PstS family phosphate ABC transporter substrate-binding protein [Bacteroidia bacterium]|nr:PstS family phosphate ABC transporter substrate-binding protein [Bacteroidia bacterium]
MIKKSTSLLLLMGLLLGCSLKDSKNKKAIRLHIKGSDTVYPLTKLLSTSFQQQNPIYSFVVEGGGSTAGIADLLAGKVDVAAASRALKPAEKAKVDSLKLELHTYTIAYDGLAVIVNAQNNLDKITKEQLQAIYQGKITNWKELGGSKEKINVYALEKNNSSDEFFKDKIMGEENYASTINRFSKPSEMLRKIASNKNAIGYYNSLQLNSKVKYLSVSYDSSKSFIAPNAFNFQNGTYPISRAMYYYTTTAKEAEMKLFIDFTHSLLGKRNIVEKGFIPAQ